MLLLARALGIKRRKDGLSAGQVERILERWIELRNYGGARNAGVATRSHEEPGTLLWVATVDAKVWREASEFVEVMPGDYMPAVYLVALLRYYEMPHLRAEAEATAREAGRRGLRSVRDPRVAEAERELALLVKTTQYKAAMRRLAVEFAACPWDGFLRVALGGGLDNRAVMNR